MLMFEDGLYGLSRQRSERHHLCSEPFLKAKINKFKIWPKRKEYITQHKHYIIQDADGDISTCTLPHTF